MAEKSFGVKEVNLIGASGTPTITSPNNLNLNAVNVAISTNVSVGGTLTVSGNVSVGGTLTYEDVTNIDSVGVVTARDGVVVVGRGVSIAAGGLNVTAGVSTFAGITTVTGNTLFAKQVNVSGVSTFQTASAYTFTVGAGNLTVNNTIYGTSKIMFLGGSGGDMAYYAGGTSYSDHIFRTLQGGSQIERFRIGASGDLGLSGENYGTSGQVLTSGGSGSAATWAGIAVTEAPVVDYTITGSNPNYYFHGGGVDETDGNPDLYLIRGQKYRFNNTTGTGHPFRFTHTGNANAAYSNGVTGTESGVQFWTIPYDAPAKLFYVCTIHNGMVGNIYISGANGQNDNVGVTTFSGSVTVGYDTTYSPIQQAANTWFYTRADQATSVSGSNIANLATGSIKISETIPISNMTRQSDAGAHSFYNSSSTSGSVTRDMTAGNPFAPKSYGLTMGTMFYAHTSGNNGSGVIHYGWTPTSHHFFVRYKYNSIGLNIGADTDGSDVWTTAYQDDLLSDSNWYFFVIAVERNGTLLTSLNGAPLTPIRMLGTAPAPTDARFGLAGDGYADNDSRHRYATAFWYRGVMSNELIAQEYAWLKTIWTGASLP